MMARSRRSRLVGGGTGGVAPVTSPVRNGAVILLLLIVFLPLILYFRSAVVDHATDPSSVGVGLVRTAGAVGVAGFLPGDTSLRRTRLLHATSPSTTRDLAREVRPCNTGDDVDVGTPPRCDACVAHACRDALIFAFRPVVYFNTAEKFFPCTIEQFLADSRLVCRRHDNGVGVDVGAHDDVVYADYGELTTENIQAVTEAAVTASACGRAPHDLMIEIRDAAHAGHNRSTLDHVPVYAHVYDDRAQNSIVVQYVFLYAYNGAQRVARIDFGAHKGDVEHVTVFINKTSERVAAIYFAAHGTGTGRLVKNEEDDGRGIRAAEEAPGNRHRGRGRLKFEGLRPVVYAARWSHASYEKKGSFPQGRPRTGSALLDHVSAYNDMTDDTGVKWRPESVVVIDESTGWNTFPGNLGGGLGANKGPRAPSRQTGWYGQGL